MSTTWSTAAWPAVQATIFTWAVTAAGSALVFVLPAEQTARQKQALDGMMGFAGGVMLSASFWSLLAPAVAFAGEPTSIWRWAPAVPVALGFGLGGAFLAYTDLWMERHGVSEASAIDIMMRGCLPPGGSIGGGGTGGAFLGGAGLTP